MVAGVPGIGIMALGPAMALGAYLGDKLAAFMQQRMNLQIQPATGENPTNLVFVPDAIYERHLFRKYGGFLQIKRRALPDDSQQRRIIDAELRAISDLELYALEDEQKMENVRKQTQLMLQDSSAGAQIEARRMSLPKEEIYKIASGGIKTAADLFQEFIADPRSADDILDEMIEQQQTGQSSSSRDVGPIATALPQSTVVPEPKAQGKKDKKEPKPPPDPKRSAAASRGAVEKRGKTEPEATGPVQSRSTRIRGKSRPPQ